MRPEKMSGTGLASLAILASMISVNLGAAFAKSLFSAVGFQGMTAYRVGIASLLLALYWRPWRHAVPVDRRASLLGFGVALGLMNLSIYSAFSRIPIGIAVAIEVTGPLFLVLYGSRTVRDLALLVLAAGGLMLLLPLKALHGAESLDPMGIASAMTAAFCWALYIVLGKRVSSLQSGQALTYGMVVAATFTVPLGIAQAGLPLLSSHNALSGLGVALFSSLIPYSLEMGALRQLSTRVFSLLVSAGPAIAALAGFLVLHEKLTLIQWTAIFCIITASAVAALSARAPEPAVDI